jgi:integrase
MMYLRNMRVYLVTVSGALGWKMVSDISSSGFIGWRSGSSLSSKTLNNYLLGWRSFIAFLVSRGDLVSCPLSQVKKCAVVPGESGRRALSMDEVGRLLSVAPAERRFIYALAVYTGLRRGEIAGLSWDDFDLSGSSPVVMLPAKLAKNRKSAVLPLRDDLRDLLLSARSAGYDIFRFTRYQL